MTHGKTQMNSKKDKKSKVFVEELKNYGTLIRSKTLVN